MHRISPPPIYNSMPASQAGVSGPALEDSLFRFLTPAANEPMPAPTSKPPQAPPSSSTTTNTAVTNNVNEVARQAGAPPIVVPTDHHRSLSANHHHHPPHHHAHHHSVSHPTTTTAMPNNNNNTSYNNYSGLLGGEGSPTGVNDIHNFPTWIDCEPPTWYTKGSDVDELLNEADALDWLADSGDLDETYKPPQPSTNNTTTNHPPIMTSTTHPPHPTTNTKTTTMEPSLVSICDGTTTSTTTPQSPSLVSSSLVGNISSDQLPQKCDSVSNIPPLPSLFGSSQNMATVACQKVTTPNLSSASLFGSATDAVNGTSDGLAVFESHFDEQAFVSALLENNESTSNILGTALQ